MPELPDWNLNVSAPRVPSGPSIGAAMAPAQAGAEVGRSVRQGTEVLAQAELRVRDFQDKGHLSGIKAKMLEAEKLHSAFREENQEESKWAEDWRKRIGEVKQYATEFEMLPENKLRAGEMVNQWEMLSSLGVEEDMRGQALNRAKLSWMNTTELLEQNHLYDELEEHADLMPGALPEEKEAFRGGVRKARSQYYDKVRLERWESASGPEIEQARKEVANSGLPSYEVARIKKALDRNEARDLGDYLQGLTDDWRARKILTLEDLEARKPEFGDPKAWQRYVDLWKSQNEETPAATKAAITALTDELWDAYFNGGMKDNPEAFEAKRNEIRQQILPYELRDDMRPHMAAFGRATWKDMQAAEQNLQKAQDERTAQAEELAMVEVAAHAREDFDNTDQWRLESMLFRKQLPGLQKEFPDKRPVDLWKVYRTRRATQKLWDIVPEKDAQNFNRMMYELEGKEMGILPGKQKESEKPEAAGPPGARNDVPDQPVGSNVTDFVKEFEGWNPKAYWDYGQTSIGYGTRAKPGEKAISKAEAEKRLAQELSKHRARVVKAAQQHGYEWSPEQIDALTSFDYNTGRLEQLIANGKRDNETIARKMLLYVNADGKKLKGLERRRRAEAQLFKEGYMG